MAAFNLTRGSSHASFGSAVAIWSCRFQVLARLSAKPSFTILPSSCPPPFSDHVSLRAGARKTQHFIKSNDCGDKGPCLASPTSSQRMGPTHAFVKVALVYVNAL